jgi:hypothetical protein
MSIGNHENIKYFFLCHDKVSLNWRFLTYPAARVSFGMTRSIGVM